MEYSGTHRIQAPADQVFEYVSDVRNLPKYLPTTKSAQPQGEDRVQVQGEAQGHQYNADGYFRKDEAGHRLEWGSDGEINYSGTLEVRDAGGGASEVTVKLRFEPSPRQAVNNNQAQADHAPNDQQIQDGINAALQSIQNTIEGQGGKVEPASAHQ